MIPAKEFLFGGEARKKLREGIERLGNVVGGTLGPKGRNVGLESPWGAPTITNDGNTIVKGVSFDNPYLNMGASLGKEIAAKMKETCGDGTTTTLLLFQALVQEGIKNIAAGASPIAIKRGIEKAVEAIIQELEKRATPIKGEEEIRNIATIAASGDEEIGRGIALALKKAGHNGVITLEEGKGTETVLDSVDGMRFERGYISPYFCNDPENFTCEMEQVKILITDKKIGSVQDILHLLSDLATRGQNLLILAENVEGETLSTLIANKLRGTLKVCAVKAPGFGEQRKEMLEDIALLTNGVFITEETGMNLKETTLDVLGEVEKVIVTKETTTLLGGRGKNKSISDRLAQIDHQLKNCTVPYEREKLEKRKGRLSGGVVVIQVGAPTEPEMKRKKQIFEDSLSSTRVALEAGVVPGGGVALLFSGRAVEGLKLKGDESIGGSIVLEASKIIFRTLLSNSGYDSALFLEEIVSKGGTYGFNVLTEKVEDLLKAKIVDPVKVVIHALRFASSAAGVVLLSEVLIAPVPLDGSCDRTPSSEDE